MLCFEEPETRTLWLAKATPRDWLVPGESPLLAQNLTTRYGRVSFSMEAVMTSLPTNQSLGTQILTSYIVRASLSLPVSFATSDTDPMKHVPTGGIRFRVRAPIEHAGKMSGVTIGG